MNDKISEKAVWDELVPSEDEKTSSASFGHPDQAQMMFCYKCHGKIPKISEYCPHCGVQLYIICPKCENKYSSEYSYCFLCGTNRDFHSFEIKKNEDKIVSHSYEWQCEICGYKYYGKEAPVECPLCHVKEHFVSGHMSIYKCMVCGYVYNGVAPPLECPMCHVGQKNFEILVNSNAI